MTFRRPLLAVALVLAGATLSACGGPRLAPDAPSSADLHGTWRLDAAASDDADAIVAAALPTPRRPAPARPALPDPPSRTDGRSALPPPGSGQREPAEFGRGGPGAFARAFAAPAVTLRISGTPRELVVEQDGRRRRLSPGDETPYSVTDRFGTRSVRAGWERDEFVIVSRGAAGFELTERFRRGGAPDTLATDVTLKARGLDTIRVQSLYRRAPDVTPAPSAAEGPPAPLR